MSNAARLEIPGTGDDGRHPVFDEGGDAWVLTGGTVTPAGTDLAALQAAVTAAVAGDTVRGTPGTTYTHAAVWVIAKSGITLDFTGCVLVASDEDASAVQITSDDVTWVGGTLRVTTTGRGTTLDHHRLVLDACSGATVRRVRIEGSKAVGVFAYGATDFLIEDVVVLDTEADTVHVTAGSARGLIQRVHAVYGGDDGFAVVSYAADAAPVSDIRFARVSVWYQQGGRGLTVVGGTGISFDGCEVVGSNGAALYIATENALGGTRDVSNVRCTGLSLVNSNVNAALDHGAICLVAELDGSNIDDVQIRATEVNGVRPAANGVLRALTPGTGTVTDVLVDDIRVTGETPGYLDWDETGGGLTVTGDVFRGEGVASKTHDFGSVTGPDGQTSTTVTVTGAAPGDSVECGLSTATGSGIVLHGNVTATDTVTVYLLNTASSGAIDTASGTLWVRVRKSPV